MCKLYVLGMFWVSKVTRGLSFKEFKDLWPEIDHTYQPGFPPDIISQEKAAEIIQFCRDQLQQFEQGMTTEKFWR